MADQAEKRARKGEDNDFPSDARTVLGPELPEGAKIWLISAEARKLFNTDPDDTAIEALQNRPEVLKRALMNRLSYKDEIEGHDSENLLSEY